MAEEKENKSKRGKTIEVHSKKSIYDAAKELSSDIEPSDKAPEGKLFQEAAGGGKPINNDNSQEGYWGTKWGRGAMGTIQKKDEARSERDSNQQPRTGDGKFTYNSANGKGLSSKSDPTRNTTVNPLLVGGKNGVKQLDLIEQLKAGKGELWDRFSEVTLVESGNYAFNGKVYSIDRVSLADEMKKQMDKQGTIDRTRRNYEYGSTKTEERDEKTGKTKEKVQLWRKDAGTTRTTTEGGVGGQISESKDRESPKGWDVEAKGTVKQGRRSGAEKETISERQGIKKSVFGKVGGKKVELFKSAKNPVYKGIKHRLNRVSTKHSAKDEFGDIGDIGL